METKSGHAAKPEEEEIPFYETITPVPSSNEEQLSDEEWPTYEDEGAKASCVSSAEWDLLFKNFDKQQTIWVICIVVLNRQHLNFYVRF